MTPGFRNWRRLAPAEPRIARRIWPEHYSRAGTSGISSQAPDEEASHYKGNIKHDQQKDHSRFERTVTPAFRDYSKFANIIVMLRFRARKLRTPFFEWPSWPASCTSL